MTGRGGLLFARLKVDVYLIADRNGGKDLILARIIIVLRPSGLTDYSSLKRKLLVFSDLDLYFALIRKTLLCAEYRNEATENGGINLLFLFGKLFRGRNLIGGS